VAQFAPESLAQFAPDLVAQFDRNIHVKKPMELLRQHIKPGEVYRRSDLEYFSSAID
jgi:hypothetical protein